MPSAGPGIVAPRASRRRYSIASARPRGPLRLPSRAWSSPVSRRYRDREAARPPPVAEQGVEQPGVAEIPRPRGRAAPSGCRPTARTGLGTVPRRRPWDCRGSAGGLAGPPISTGLHNCGSPERPNRRARGRGDAPAASDSRGAPGRAATAPARGRVDSSGAPPKARPPRGRHGHAHHERVGAEKGLRRAERAVAAEGARPSRPALPALHRPLAVLRAQHRRPRRPGRGLSPRRRPRVRRGGGRSDPADSGPPREQPHRLVEERRRPAPRRAPVPRAGHERDASRERHGARSSPTPTCSSPCR